MRRRRGGYCVEHNGVMSHILSHLDFDVDILGGRVVWTNTSGELPAKTHMASPIRFEVGTEQKTRHEPYRILERDGGYVLESRIRSAWEPLYLFSENPFPMIDRGGETSRFTAPAAASGSASTRRDRSSMR